VRPRPIDLTGDGLFGRRDFAIVAAHFGMVTGATLQDGDLNGDGAVNTTDVAWAQSMLGQTASSPSASPSPSEFEGAPPRLVAARRSARPAVSSEAADFVLASDSFSVDQGQQSVRRVRRVRGTRVERPV
jgi:hypothetical protein